MPISDVRVEAEQPRSAIIRSHPMLYAKACARDDPARIFIVGPFFLRSYGSG